jgi:hypothetical protein
MSGSQWFLVADENNLIPIPSPSKHQGEMNEEQMGSVQADFVSGKCINVSPFR